MVTRSAFSSISFRWFLASALLASPLLGVACVGAIGGESAGQGGDDSSGNVGGAGGAGGVATGSSSSSGSASSSGSGGSSSSSGSSSSTSSGGGTPAEMVCARWKADRANMSEGTWSGSVAGCNAGDISADGRDNALRLVNLYRFLGGLPPVGHDATRNQKAQACALMMQANGTLDHYPPSNWTCYSADGKEAAGMSNISGGPGVSSVDLYMSDVGNETTMGHRRWILSNSLGPIGLGSTSGYSCMWVIGGGGNGGEAFMAWPPAGIVPFEAFKASFASIDQTGWTIQSDSIDLSGAEVSIVDNGQARPVVVTQLGGGYGSAQAIRNGPSGWTTQPGHTYAVTVAGGSQPISYAVEVVDCN